MKQHPLLNLSRICCLIVCGTVLLIGCGKSSSKPLPETFPVKGSLKDKSDTPVKDGMIFFQSPDNAEHASQAEIQPDGSFELFTLVEGQRLDGARPGEYRATFNPRMSDAQSEVPVELDETFSVKAGENVFEIKLKN
ncbi:MAG: cytochrome P450 [Planctomycetes bacterium]|nr:cytochrome P450 [Planctomycetota bacterium]MCH9723505.1 cytochrome P450 [Planctomycetota bacterium]MCH9775298.1 cytochrome P450 [Planctomycetota bacterium]MCH9790659.1 cytochrome P450 [Planctomycetota bacterium]